MAVNIVYFVHGTTTDNEAKLCSGWREAMLSDLGREQAHKLGNTSRKRGDRFDVVITSDLERAIETSNIAFPECEKLTDKRLRECNYGDLDGEHKSLVIYEEHVDEAFPNGESLKDVENRIREFVQYLKDNYDNQTVAIIAHRAPQLALDVVLKGKSWEDANKDDWRKHGAWQPGWEYIIY